MKSSRLGVGSLIRGKACPASVTVSAVPRLFFGIAQKRLKAKFYTRCGIAPNLFGMRKNDTNNDSSLMEGFRHGQHNCFTEIFNMLYAPLCYYAAQITQDQAAAEDIVEDSFIKIWERREIFFEVNVLKSYIYTTVRNASLNWIKKNRKAVSLPENIEVLFEEDNSFKHILTSEVFNKLSKALEQLSPQGKQIIKMIFFEGKNTRCIAEELGISQSTVKTQKGRSLLKLRAGMISAKQ